MSFIDLMGNVVFTDKQILKRTEAMIRNVFSAEAETILNRKVQEIHLGQAQMTPELEAEIALFAKVTKEAKEAGEQAKADNELLKQVLAYENAERTLTLSWEFETTTTDEEGNEITSPQYEVFLSARADAENCIKNASKAVVNLVEKRRQQDVEEISDDPTIDVGIDDPSTGN